MTEILKRPGIRFIACLPTLCVHETTYKNMVLWKIELPKPVIIPYGCYPDVSTFWVEIMTVKHFDKNSGWESKMLIGIKKTKMANTYIIEPHDVDFYLKTKWWSWENKGIWK